MSTTDAHATDSHTTDGRPATFSPVATTRRRHIPGFNDQRALDLDALGVLGSPVVVVDDFRVAELAFPPHPHAGFAAVTYVFEDSNGGLRSRSSMGGDVTVGPGGIVWSEAGRGMLHEEAPADRRRELHGAQIFVNVSAANRLCPPRVLALQADEIPEWRNSDGDSVRVVVGTHDGISSSLEPIEPFTLLELEVHHQVAVAAPEGHHLVVYVRTGAFELDSGDRTVAIDAGQTIALRGGGEPFTVRAHEPGKLLVLGGAAIDEPLVMEGSFIMNERQQVAEAVQRYRRGEMGALEPSSR